MKFLTVILFLTSFQGFSKEIPKTIAGTKRVSIHNQDTLLTPLGKKSIEESSILKIESLDNRLTQEKDNTYEPDSVFVNGRNVQYYDSHLVPSKKAVGGSIFIGYGILDGNISNYFSNPFLIGLNVDLHKNRRIIEIGGHLGFGKTIKTMNFPDQLEWKENKFALSVQLGSNLGYSIVDSKNLLLVPFAGLGFGAITSSVLVSSENSTNEPLFPCYKVGFFIDFKSIVLLQDHIRINEKDENYTGLRLSIDFNAPIGSLNYPEYYEGSLINITLGMGGLSRNYSTKK